MRIDKCYFCSCNVYPGHGTAFVRNDSKLFRFCSSKCNKLFKAKKNPRKLKWTKAYRVAHGKEMTNDSVLEFEQKRNVPTRYNRDLMVKTLQAMKRVDEIKAARQERFFNARMEKAKGTKRSSVVNELMQHVDMISNPKTKTLIARKKKEKAEAKLYRQTGGERGRLNRKAQGIHLKLDLEDEDDENDEMQQNVASSEDEAEPVAVKAPVLVQNKKRVPKKHAKKAISK